MIDGGLRPLIRKNLPQVHWTSIETGGTGRGVPDLFGCYQGIAFWIECKVTSGWNVTLRPEQIGWLEGYARAGGRGFVAVRRRCEAGRRRQAADQLWLIGGRGARAARLHGLAGDPQEGPGAARAGARAAGGKGRGGAATAACEALLVGEGGPGRWPWPSLLNALLADDQ